MPLVFVNLLQFTGMKGGMETYARELYREIGTMDSGFEFVGYGSREFMSLDQSWFPGEVIDSGISGENRFSWARGELFSVGAAADRLGADLIHGPSMFGPLRSKAPVVISVHDMLYFSNPELMSTRLYTEPVKWMEKRGSAHATRIITISEFSAAAIRRYLRVSDDKLDVIPLAGTFREGSQVAAAARQPALFLAVGQRRPHKNFENVLRGLATIPAEERPQLVVTGSHGDDPLVAMVDALGLGQWVTLKSWVSSEELESLYQSATALVDASLVTGFSLPTLEAMMIGLPVALADTAVFREVGGTAAEYFDPTDPEAIGATIHGLAGNTARLAEMAAAGRTRAAEFSWNKTATATLRVFHRAISEHTAR